MIDKDFSWNNEMIDEEFKTMTIISCTGNNEKYFYLTLFNRAQNSMNRSVILDKSPIVSGHKPGVCLNCI